MTKQDLLGPLLTDNKLIEPTANFLRCGEPSAEIRAAPPAGFPAPVLPIKPFPAGARDPDHIDPPHGGARGHPLGGGLPGLAPDLRRLPAVGPASGDGVQGGGGGAGETAVLLLLLAPEEGPRASEGAGAAAALLPLLRGAARVDAARGGERGRRGAGGADGGRHGQHGEVG